MTELLSHPEKYLLDHLSEVAKIAKLTIESEGFNFSLSSELQITNKQLTDLVWLAGAFHDIGKATSYFQDYIRNPEKTHNKLKNHALLSSLFAYFISRKYTELNFSDGLLKELLPCFIFTAVKRHHGKIENLDNEILLNNEQFELLSQQIESIDKIGVSKIIDSLLTDFSIKVAWEDFVLFIRNKSFDNSLEDFSFDILNDKYLKIPKDTRITLFYLHQTIYSALLFADKNDVILNEIKSDISKTNILAKLDLFRNHSGFNKPVSEIDKLKNEAYFSSLNNLDRVFLPEQHIYSVTLPTGLGKTLTSFAIGDKIRKLANLNRSRIIINIPFTSIIDQNFEVYTSVLESTQSKTIIKHHHLAEPIYKDKNENILLDSDKSQFLIETWQSETIVTTFVQFLESILSCDKAKLMKLVHLKNSVILLDEIQTIPYPLWETIRKSFNVIGKTYNIYFILISATQPLIFTPREDIVEIVPDYEKYFKFFNRTQINYYSEPIQFIDFNEKLIDYAAINPSKDILVILNTKESSRKCFEAVVNSTSDNSELYYLSTLITPSERKEIINRIKKKSKKRKIIVSTQLVEAGVDISVDTIFRQISPIDSIIQSAGRANRYYENDIISDVFVYDIEDLQKATNSIYGSDLILKTKNVLNEFQTIQECDYILLIKKYFKEVRKQSDETTSELLNAILKLKFKEIDLKLIEERNTESVFIQINNEAKEVWNKYLNIFNNNSITPWERKAQFSEIKAIFYDYVINIPILYNELKINFDSEKVNGFYVSYLENPSDFYHYDSKDYKNNIGYVDLQTLVI